MSDPITDERLNDMLADVEEANQWYHVDVEQRVIDAIPELVAEVRRLREVVIELDDISDHEYECRGELSGYCGCGLRNKLLYGESEG